MKQRRSVIKEQKLVTGASTGLCLMLGKFKNTSIMDKTM
jgi:hypothetical protein